MRAWTRLRSRFGGSAPAETPAGRDVLKWVAAAFALVATATAEYEIARAIGMNEWVAAAVPGALDAYVVRALRTHREVLTAVLAMVAVNAASHLVTARVLPVEWPLITAVSAIAPLVLWRVHALGTPGDWRARKLWGLSKDEHAAVLASTEPEHDRAPEPPENACDWCGYSYRGLDVPFHKEHACAERFEHKPSTDQARVRAQTEAWGDDWMDVHDAVHTSSTPPVPVHAPYADHVPMEPTGLLTVPGMNPVRARHLEVVRDDEHTASTRTADDWNLEHVATGVLEPEDTVHMDRARELFHTIGGVPPFRALKEGDPGMGTPRAKRIRAALKAENEGTS